MIRAKRPTNPDRSARGRNRALWLLAALVAPGCHKEAESEYEGVSKPPSVRVIHPEVRNLVRYVEQPSFVESYERTSIYPKVMGYIEKWNVDIGDTVKKGQVLCLLYAPELVEDYATKNATVVLDQRRIELAQRVVKVAEANVKAARARVKEAKAILGRYQAEVDRWDTEVKRLKRETDRGVLSPEILLESTNQWKSAIAWRDSADATVVRDEAELLSRQEELAKAEVDVEIARADLAVAESAARYAKAWMDYLTITAPYDGVIVARNANTGDFVLPRGGDPTAMSRAPHLAPGGTAAPIYVVDRTDVVRIFVDIPEQDADYVHVGTKASLLIEAYRDQTIQGTVTRTAWALNSKSRTLRAEIDLPNKEKSLLPGMYAYAEVTIERQRVRTLPRSALTYRGDQAFYWAYENGKAVRIEAETGVNNDEWIEVTNRRTPGTGAEHLRMHSWTPIDGSEQVIVGDLSILTEGAPVRVESAASARDIARADPGSSSAKPTTAETKRSP